MPDKLKQLDEILKVLDKDVASTAEVAELFEGLISALDEVRAQLLQQAQDNKLELSGVVSESTARNLAQIDTLSGKLNAQLEKVKSDMSLEVDTLTMKVFEELREVKDSIPEMPDLSAIIESLDKHGKIIDTIPELTDDLVERMEDIEEAQDTLTKTLAKTPKNIKSGGTSAIGVRQTFKYIFHTEVPVGVIDGANKAYTVEADIWAIMAFSLNGEVIPELPNYTFTGKTITFGTALPSAYSGKDFEIKYIG